MVHEYIDRVRRFSPQVRLVLLMWLLAGFALYGVGLVLRSLYILRLGYGPEFIGLLGAVSSLGFTLFCFPCGAIGDRWGCQRAVTAGVVLWIHNRVGHGENLTKKHPGVIRIHEWIMKQYEQGRTTTISDAEMLAQIREHLAEWLEECGFEI